MNFNTNQISVQATEPSKKLLLITLASMPLNIEADTPHTEPSIDTAEPSIDTTEPSIDTDFMTEIDLTVNKQTTATDLFNDFKSTAVDTATNIGEFGSNVSNHKATFSEWKMFFFFINIIYAAICYASTQENAMTKALRVRLYETMANTASDEYDFESGAQKAETFLWWRPIITDFFGIVIAPLAMSGLMPCPAFLLNTFLLPIIPLANTMTWLHGFLSLLVVFLIFYMLGKYTYDIYGAHYSNEVYFELPIPKTVPHNFGKTKQEIDEAFVKQKNWEQAAGPYASGGVENDRRLYNVNGFTMEKKHRLHDKCNIFVRNEDQKDNGLMIDNSKGFARSFIIELNKLMERTDTQILYLTKDSVVYCQSDGARSGSSPTNDTPSGRCNAAIHGMKIGESGIERKELHKYSYQSVETVKHCLGKYSLWYEHKDTEYAYGVWTVIHEELEKNTPGFDFIPSLKSVFFRVPTTIEDTTTNEATTTIEDTTTTHEN